MTYELVLRKQPDKYLEKLPDKIRQTLKSTFQILKSDLYSIARRLHGQFEGLYKVRVNNFRIIIEIDKQAQD